MCSGGMNRSRPNDIPGFFCAHRCWEVLERSWRLWQGFWDSIESKGQEMLGLFSFQALSWGSYKKWGGLNPIMIKTQELLGLSCSRAMNMPMYFYLFNGENSMGTFYSMS